MKCVTGNCSWVRKPASILAVGALLAFLGCSSGGKATVSGEVTVDDKPVAEGLIGFAPADGVGPSAQAQIAAGRYSIAVPMGPKIVTIEAIEKTGDSYPNGPGSAPVPLHKVVSPAKYANAKTSDLRYEVKSSDAKDFHLKSAGR